MKHHTLTLVALSCLLWQNATIALAQGTGGQQVTLTITGKEPGAYNIKATVQKSESAQNVPLSNNSATDNKTAENPSNRRPPMRALVDSVAGFNEFMDIMSGEYNKRLRNENNAPPETPTPTPTPTPKPSSPPYLTDSSLGSSSGSSGQIIYPTDGSPGSQQITARAFDELYEYLPNQIIDRLNPYGSRSGSSSDSSGSSDPYSDFSSAIQSGDFNRARDLANANNQADFNQRIAMLTLAGAMALRNIMDSNQNPSLNTFPARDILGKLAEDLHYAGEGLSPDDPNDAKLKVICQDISRVWGNMSQPKQKSARQ